MRGSLVQGSRVTVRATAEKPEVLWFNNSIDGAKFQSCKSKLPSAPPGSNLASPHTQTPQPAALAAQGAATHPGDLSPAEAQLLLVAPQHRGSGLHRGLGQHVVEDNDLPKHTALTNSSQGNGRKQNVVLN